MKKLYLVLKKKYFASCANLYRSGQWPWPDQRKCPGKGWKAKHNNNNNKITTTLLQFVCEIWWRKPLLGRRMKIWYLIDLKVVLFEIQFRDSNQDFVTLLYGFNILLTTLTKYENVIKNKRCSWMWKLKIHLISNILYDTLLS